MKNGVSPRNTRWSSSIVSMPRNVIGLGDCEVDGQEADIGELVGQAIGRQPMHSNVRRRGSPSAAPIPWQRREDKENASPHLHKENPVDHDGTRRSGDYRRVSFTPVEKVNESFTPPRTTAVLERETPQQRWVYDNDGEAIEVSDSHARADQEGKPTNTAESIDVFSSPSLDGSRPSIHRSNAEMELITSDKMYDAPTQLHEVCYKAASVDDLIEFLRSPQVRGRDLSLSATTKDSRGRIPLHLFSENHAFATSFFSPVNGDDDFQMIHPTSSYGRDQSNDKKLTKFILEALLSTNPDGVNWMDTDGYVPFERSLSLWIRRVYSEKQFRSNRTITSDVRRKSFSTDPFQSMWASTTMTVSSAMTWAGRSLHFSVNPRDDHLSEMEDCNLEEASEIDPRVPTTFPSSVVRLTPMIRFCIKTLSLILERLEETAIKTSSRSHRNSSFPRLESLQSDSFDAALDSFRTFCQGDTAMDIAKDLVAHIAKIPNFVLTVLLIDDQVDRDWVLTSVLFKRVAIQHFSVNTWINAMLQNPNKSIARRGLEYLRYASDIATSSKASADAYLEAIAHLDGFVPSLLTLEERQIEDAATTFIVRSVLDKMIYKPFAATVVFCDLFFICILMVGFRCSVNKFLLGEAPESILKWIYVANTGIFYFVIRELGKCITILERTRQARIYLWSIWNIADILSTVFAMTSTILLRKNFSEVTNFEAIDPLRAFLAITTGCLWIRALSMLKSLNIHLATFVLAILQICKDILWFLIILGALVACFAQMFYTLLLPPACATDEAYRESSLQCSQSEYYLRLYTILGNLGGFDEFNRDAFTTAFSVFLLVFFSFMAVIILLNILIAIVSDSYEKCLIRSHYLFGRARVLLISELDSFQNLLQTQQNYVPRDDSKSSFVGKYCLRDRGWSRESVAFFFLSIFVIFLWLVGEVAGSFFGVRYGNLLFSFLSILVNVLLFAAIVIFLSRGSKDSIEIEGAEKQSNSRWYEFFQQAMFRLLATSTDSSKRSNNTDNDWKGRMNYLHEEMDRISEQSIERMESQMACLQIALTGQTSMEVGLANLRQEINSSLRDIEARNAVAQKEILDAIESRHVLAHHSNAPKPRR